MCCHWSESVGNILCFLLNGQNVILRMMGRADIGSWVLGLIRSEGDLENLLTMCSELTAAERDELACKFAKDLDSPDFVHHHIEIQKEIAAARAQKKNGLYNIVRTTIVGVGYVFIMTCT